MITRPRIKYIVRDPHPLHRFQSQIRGDVLFPDHPEYNQARRVWNGMIDRYPTVIVRPADSRDVALAVGFARDAGLPVGVRGGGHSAAGLAVPAGGLMIDLSQMKGICVHRNSLVAHMQPGVTLGEFVDATEAHGLATTTGTVSGTGMAGLTLGGGMGWLHGQYGLTVDNLLSVEIVTANGQILVADENEHGDLFWAVRGGGGNFGIVTSFEYRLHPVGQMLSGLVAYPFEQAREVLRFYREFSHDAPDELTAYAAIVSSPEGNPMVGVLVNYNGRHEIGERALASLRAFGTPIVDTIRSMPYSQVVRQIDAGAPDGLRYYEKANAIPTLTDEAIDAIVAAGAARISPRSQVLIQHVHGAAARIAPEATAAAGLRGEHYVAGFVSVWEHGVDAPHIDWARTSFERTRPFARGAMYVNFLGSDDQSRVRAAYGVNYDRLAGIKAKYDPQNVFHNNQNIRPAM